MFLKNLKIGERLAIGFGVILLISATILLITASSLNTVYENTIRVENESLPYERLADNMAFQTLEVLELLLYASTTQRTDGFKKAEEVVADFKQNIAKFREMYKRKGNAASLRAIKELDTAFDQYYEHGKEMAFVYFTEGMEEGNELIEPFENTAKILTNRMKELQKQEMEKTKTSVCNILDSVSRMRSVMFSMNGLAAILSVLIAFYITHSITGPVHRVLSGFRDIAEGDLTVRLEAKTRDEMGELAQGFNMFSEKLQEVILEVVDNMKRLNTTSDDMAGISTQMASSAAEMNSQAGTAATASEQVSTNFNKVASSTNQAKDSLAEIALMTDDMSETFSKVAGFGKKTADNVVRMARSSEDISSQVGHIASAIEKVTLSLNDVAKNTAQANRISQLANRRTEQINAKMEMLVVSSGQIGKIVGVIKKIADQTNMLALNAAIEAAGAGEAGRGFAIVAGEVKELARQSADATDEIAGQIEDIQTSVRDTVQAIEEISKIIGEIAGINETIAASAQEQTATAAEISKSVAGTAATVKNVAENANESANLMGEIARSTDETSKTAAEISRNIDEVLNSARSIAVSSDEAARGVSDISENIQRISAASNQTAIGASETNMSSKKLAEMASSLMEIISKFKL